MPTLPAFGLDCQMVASSASGRLTACFFTELNGGRSDGSSKCSMLPRDTQHDAACTRSISAITSKRFPYRLPKGTRVFLAACRKEANAACPFPLTNHCRPHCLEGSTSASRLDASRNCRRPSDTLHDPYGMPHVTYHMPHATYYTHTACHMLNTSFYCRPRTAYCRWERRLPRETQEADK
jgi:hypothetical protein